ncbi:MAG: T9SS type A sorting domain-containing protein [Ignavibacteria bacterium]|nr:T9SS type A sorting domain-containing protein [Ignavibacteria bacterium]
MTKKAIFFFMTIAAVLSFNAVSAQWLPGNQINLDVNPCVTMASNNTVFIAGGHNINNSRGVVYKSVDGGITFSSVRMNSTIKKIFSIYSTNENTIYIGEGNNDGGLLKGAKVWKTTDNGLNWTNIVNLGTKNGFINFILFSNSNPSFGVIQSDPESNNGGDFKLWKTTNGGLNWTSFSAPDAKSTGYQNSGFVIDANFFGFGLYDSSKIEITRNGGLNWSIINIPCLEKTGISSISFSNNKLNGIAASRVTESTVARTTNGGLTWFSQSISANKNTISGTGFVKYIPGTSSIYLMVSNSTGTVSYKSIDNGETWEILSVPSQIKDINDLAVYYSGSGNAGAFAGSSSTVPIKLIDPTPLPVKLQSFSYSVSGQDVNLNWVTSSEVNNNGFEIERENDGNWLKIGFVKGIGNSNQQNSYKFSDKKVGSGKFSYRIKQIDYNGNYEYFNLNGQVAIGTPAQFKLSQNYPNPFNPVTKIDFELSQDASVSIKVYDMTGREVSGIFEGTKTAGYYTVQFDGSKLCSGIYYYSLIANSNGIETVITKKMNLIK